MGGEKYIGTPAPTKPEAQQVVASVANASLPPVCACRDGEGEEGGEEGGGRREGEEGGGGGRREEGGGGGRGE